MKYSLLSFALISNFAFASGNKAHLTFQCANVKAPVTMDVELLPWVAEMQSERESRPDRDFCNVTRSLKLTNLSGQVGNFPLSMFLTGVTPYADFTDKWDDSLTCNPATAQSVLGSKMPVLEVGGNAHWCFAVQKGPSDWEAGPECTDFHMTVKFGATAGENPDWSATTLVFDVMDQVNQFSKTTTVYNGGCVLVESH